MVEILAIGLLENGTAVAYLEVYTVSHDSIGNPHHLLANSESHTPIVNHTSPECASLNGSAHHQQQF